ncbi:uncharacterized protein [Diadema antillarum]|uniref:uncharacterized protein n=1 Tax=Diadema antillarum TaxID=105358 RepID=UPI003A8A48D1
MAVTAQDSIRLIYDRDFLLHLNPHSREVDILMQAPVNLLLKSKHSAGHQRRCRKHRGKRGGRRKQRQIRVHTASNLTDRIWRYEVRNDNGRNLSNIVNVPQEHDCKLNVQLWNCNSVRNKTNFLLEHVIDSNVDIMFLTETWLLSVDPVVIDECTPAGYTFLNVARGRNDPLGGIAVIYKTALNLSTANINILSSHDTFELAAVANPSRSICYVVIYRPPPSMRNGFKTQEFLQGFEELVCELTTYSWKLLILGDFNMHEDTPRKPDVAYFLEIIEEAGLQQHVTTATHKLGHTLDLVISRLDESPVVDCRACDKLYSDHFIISCTVDAAKPKQHDATSHCRNFRNLDKGSFITDINEAFHDFPFDGDVDDQTAFYHSTILDVLNKHCPSTKRVHRFCRHPPWYTNEIHQARRSRRKLERRWRKLQTPESRHQYLTQIHAVCRLIHKEKSKYYREKLKSADVKNVFRVLNTLLNRSPAILPADMPSTCTSLPDRFATFFVKKVEKIRENLQLRNEESHTDVCSSGSIVDTSGAELADFDAITAQESAYRRWHSTETALLKVQDDILRALDNKLVTFIVFLDLSAAFDCVDHDIMLARLTSNFGISGSVKAWFTSYLSDRSFRLKVTGYRSFSAAAQRLWNQLPQSIRESPSLSVFQKSWKTFLFKN